MKKELNRFEQVGDGAFFAVDVRAFEATITSYDPLVANQTLLSTEDKSRWDENDESGDNHNEPSNV